MPRSGRKNPTPKRVTRRIVDSSEEEVKSEHTPESVSTTKNEILQGSILGQMATLPNDPDALGEIVDRMPMEALYKENDVSDTNLITTPNENGEYVCQKCDKVYKSMSGLRYHINNACTSSKCKFTCLVCGAEYIRHQEVLNHIAIIHLTSSDSRNRPTRKATKTTVKTLPWDEDASNNVFSVDSMDTAEEDFVPDEKEMEVKSNKKRGPNIDKSTFATVERPFHDVMPWLYQYMHRLEEKFGVTHRSITQNINNLIIDTNFDLSQIGRSPPFQIIHESKKNIPIECDGLAPLTGLESPDNENTCTLNAGGPVWALAWCPTSLNDLNRKQYIAISSHAGVHSMSLSYYESGLIQLWDCGFLKLHNNDNETPFLSYALSVNDAPVWDLKWCPIGGLIISGNGDNDDARLGVLAAACASGKIHIIAMPPPNETDVLESRIYKAKPSLSLLPTYARSDIENLFGQCMCVDWTLSDGGEWIAGGYCKGLVALWKIKDISSLLLSKSADSDAHELTACRTFHAHNKIVRSLCWCPYDENVLATAGYDRFIKFWNKGYTEAPIMQTQVKGSLYTQVTWPVLWCGVYASTEEAFAASFNHGLSYQDLMLRTQTTLIPFKSVCWSVSCSNWMNCVIGGDAMGQTVMYTCSNWSRKVRAGKGCLPRLLLFSTSVHWSLTDNSQSEDDISDPERSMYKLVFHDTNFGNMDNAEKRDCCKKVRLQDSYPATCCDKPLVQSVNRVSWNPNFGSHTWIASGMQCGLVRLHCVDAMHASEMDNQYDSLNNRTVSFA